MGARTHATIAAYSTCVPTLVVGYSVKARGIARDLFGTEDGYVLPVQELSAPDQLSKSFAVLYGKRDAVHDHLSRTLPDYLARAQAGVDAVKGLSLYEDKSIKVRCGSSYLNLLIGNIIPFVYTPIMLRLLGQSEYGLYGIAQSIMGYIGLLNLESRHHCPLSV